MIAMVFETAATAQAVAQASEPSAADWIQVGVTIVLAIIAALALLAAARQAKASDRQAAASEDLVRQGALAAELAGVPLLRLDVTTGPRKDGIQLGVVLTNFSQHAALAVRLDVIGGEAIDHPLVSTRQTVSAAPVILPQAHVSVAVEPLNLSLADDNHFEVLSTGERVRAFTYSWLTFIASFETVAGTSVRMIWQWATDAETDRAWLAFALTDLVIEPAAVGSQRIELRFRRPTKTSDWGDPWEKLVPRHMAGTIPNGRSA